GFNTFCGTCAPGHFNVNSYQVADDVDLVRGPHQISMGFNLIRVQNNTVSGFNENGNFTFNAAVTGLGLADFMLGKPSDFTQTNATPDDLRTWLMSFYVQDSYKMSKNVTWNFGLRWEPTFSDPDKYGRGTSFSLPAFLAGQFSTVHPNAPAGLFFKGDAGIPDAMWNGKKANFAPRVGWVWNPHGDGRDTFRVGAAILYDSTETWFNERETTNAPYGTALDTPFPVGGFSNPWQGYPGGNPFPTNGKAYFPVTAGVYVNMPINPKPTSVIQWNATYQRQVGKDWLLSASYLGNKTNHLWIASETNPAIFLGLGTCVLNGVTYNPCSSTNATNTLYRRRLALVNPALGAAYASIDTMDDGAVAHYDGMLLTISHRFASNFTFNANYTYAMCLSDYDFGAALATSTNSQLFNRHADYGPCVSDTRHIFNATFAATSAWKLSNHFVGAIVNNWQLAPLIHAASGQPLTVTVGKDNSLTNLGNDRPVQVLQNVYANNSTPCPSQPFCVAWVNPAAFVPNALGTYGNVGRNALRGPGNFNMDVSLSRIFKIRESLNLQARADFFNALNHTNFVGAISPAGTVTGYSTLSANESASSFGQVQSAFDPRIIQFSMKLNF
ncbi:MAG TPA: carboxypeptidase regulatory-like domain-containing protein, partial [Bryobacteraceae bacterium]